MRVLVVGLAAGLALALCAVLYLALVLPRRVMRLVREERLAAEVRARADTGALKQAIAVEVQGLVYALRGYHDEIHQRARIAREITTAAATEEIARIVGPLRGLLTWLLAAAGEPFPPDIPTTPKPAHVPISRERLPTRPPAVAPPGSSVSLPPGPALTAVGLGPRPERAASAPERAPPPPSGARARARDSGAGIAPPRTEAPSESGDLERPSSSPARPPFPATPTLVSVVAIGKSGARPDAKVVIEHRRSEQDRGAS